MYFIHNVLSNIFRPVLLPTSGWYYYNNTKVPFYSCYLYVMGITLLHSNVNTSFFLCQTEVSMKTNDITRTESHIITVQESLNIQIYIYIYYIIIISIQPEGRFWQEPEPSQATGMALTHCILGSFLGVGCHCFPPSLDVPTFASRCLHVQATWETSISQRRNYGREMAGQFYLWFRLPRKPRVLWHAAHICDMGDGFTSPPPKREACCGFFRPKNPTASAGIVYIYREIDGRREIVSNATRLNWPHGYVSASLWFRIYPTKPKLIEVIKDASFSLKGE